jgi:hypothetical protein
LRFQVLTATGMKMTVLGDIAPCSLVEIEWRFRGAYCLHHQGNDGGSKHLSNVGKLLPDYTAQQPRRQPSWRWDSSSYYWVTERRLKHLNELERRLFYHHLTATELGHLLACSGLNHPKVSLKVILSFSIHLACNFLIAWDISFYSVNILKPTVLYFNILFNNMFWF